MSFKYTGTIIPMITDYDWVKPARDKNSIQKSSGVFSRSEELTRGLFSSQNLQPKYNFNKELL